MRKRGYRDNPRAVLLLAIPFLLGGVMLLISPRPIPVVASPVRGRVPDANSYEVETASVPMERAGGVLGIIVAGIIVGTYFKIRDGRG